MSAHHGIPVPPLTMAAAGVLQLVLPKTRQPRLLPRIMAAALATGSAALLIATLGEFTNRNTTFDPTAPEQASTLITDGPNTFSRNPMYLGMTGLLAAHALWRGPWLAGLPAAAFVATIDRVQIPREEAALQQIFGRDFENYRARTRRWLGRSKESA